MKYLRKVTFTLTVVAIMTFGMIDVSALGYIFPSINYTESSGAPPTSDTVETVAISGYTTPSSSVWGIDTGVTEYKVYVNAGHSSDNIRIQYACEGNPHGGTDMGGRDYEFPNGVSQTRWQLYRTDSNENPTTLIDTINSYDAICNNSMITQTFTASGSPTSGIPGHGGYRVYIVRAYEISESGPDGAGKGFKIRSQWASTHITPSELNFATSQVNGTAWPGNQAYALLDGIRQSSRPDSTYRFRFSPDCRYPNNTRAYIKWYDADIGVNQDTGMQMRMFKNGVAVPLQAYRTISGTPPSGTNTPIGDGNTVLAGSELMGGNSGSGAYGVASFIAERDARYEVRWTGVNNTNALQFWLPFSEINSTVTCPDVEHDVTGTCSAIRGYFVYPLRPQEKYEVGIQLRLEGDAWSSPIYLDADDSTPDPPGNNFSNGFNLTSIPSQYISATRRTQFRVFNDDYGAGRIYLSTGSTIGYCGGWDYDPTLSPTGTRSVKPGETFTVTTGVTNTGNVRGDNYLHALRTITSNWSGNIDVNSYSDQTGSHNIARGTNLYVNWEGRSGLSAGGSASRNVTYRVEAGATHGTRICFEGRVSPAGANPTRAIDTTRDGEGTVYTSCVEIYNWQYDVNVVAQPDVKGEPNQDVQVDFNLFNTPNGHNNANGPTPSSPRIRVQFSDTYREGSPSGFVNDQAGPVIPSNGSEPWSVDIEIPSDAVVGEVYCVRLRVAGAWGYSDGSDFNTGRIDGPEEICARVTEGPYLQTFGNDIWAGGNYDYDNDGSCTPLPGPGNIISINNTVSGVSFGALNEYGQYALGFVVGFGSAGIANDSHALTFANTELNAGNFQETRCLSRLFDADGTIFDGLWNNADGVLSNISNTSNSTASGQYTTPIGNQTMDNGNFSGSGGSNRLTRLFTVLVEGDLTIEKSIAISESGWSFGSIPGITFIVSGNIYINPSVERLDGIYIARGTIDTCALDTNDGFSDALTIDMCTEHLEVNGKFIANNIAFRRTWGGTNGARPGGNSSRCVFNASQLGRVMNPSSFYAGNANISCAAETFRYNPAFYLSEPILNYGIGGDPNDFPIQQIRDLPPVY